VSICKSAVSCQLLVVLEVAAAVAEQTLVERVGVEAGRLF
jgi:hypothetical protein